MKRKTLRPFQDRESTLKAAHLGWWGTVLFAAGRAFEIIPLAYGSFGLLFLGLGIAASVSLGRFGLADTMTQVFQVGLRSAITLSANVFTDTCIMILDKHGCIEKADHADAIGWSADELKGRELHALLAPRSHGTRLILPGTSITSPMVNQKGERFDARLSIASLDGSSPMSSDNVTGQRMVVTVSPVVNPEGTYNLT